MRTLHLKLLFFGFLGLAFVAPQLKKWSYPKHFPTPIYSLNNEEHPEARVALGRALFYDPILSADSTISCASCHSPFNAFAHTDHDLSHGINDAIGTRNAPALFNLAWQRTFMWDGAMNHLEMQALAPIHHPKEMNEDIAHVVEKLQRSPFYSGLFQNAFGSAEITGTSVLKAIASFELSLISCNSKYDQVQQKQATFTEQEKNGYALFKKYCNSCHREPLFSTYQFANNGLSTDTTLNDLGRMIITNNPADKHHFKIPSLRNLTYSFPYMHDGRFKKLSQVITHYTEEIVDSPTLSDELRQPIILSSTEKVDLVSFLLTLNDQSFVRDTSHQFPKTILHRAKDIR